LKIKYYFKTSDDSISAILNRIVPLKKFTKLIIQCYDFPFEQIVKLIRFTSNLDTLEFSFLSHYNIDPTLIKKTDLFKHVSNTNKIKNLDIIVVVVHWKTCN